VVTDADGAARTWAREFFVAGLNLVIFSTHMPDVMHMKTE
jgi:hypothetical protein